MTIQCIDYIDVLKYFILLKLFFFVFLIDCKPRYLNIFFFLVDWGRIFKMKMTYFQNCFPKFFIQIFWKWSMVFLYAFLLINNTMLYFSLFAFLFCFIKNFFRFFCKICKFLANFYKKIILISNFLKEARVIIFCHHDSFKTFDRLFFCLLNM